MLTRLAWFSQQPTLSIDAAPIRTLTKAITGGVAFAVGKTLDISPRVKLGKLPVKVRLQWGVLRVSRADAGTRLTD